METLVSSFSSTALNSRQTYQDTRDAYLAHATGANEFFLTFNQSNLASSSISNGRLLAAEVPHVSDSSMALALDPLDGPIGVTLCTEGGNLSGIQVEYGRWEPLSMSYLRDTKLGRMHGEIKGECNSFSWDSN